MALDRWVEPVGSLTEIASAVDGRIVARISSAGLDFAAMTKYAREVGGSSLRELSFHQRADRLRALAPYLSERKESLYRLAGDTGANRRDNAIDIEGGIGTLSAYASRGRRDLPDAKFVVEGDVASLSPGSLQLICGGTGDLFDHLGGQDVISFTGSIETSERLRAHPNIAKHSIRFVAERDSLNAAMLGPDVTPEQPEFELFVREVVREMTAKAGQKCTAIRRILVPRAQEAGVIAALRSSLAQIRLGDPRSDDKAMGPLVSRAQRDAVRAQIGKLQSEAEIVFGDPNRCTVEGIDPAEGAFMSPVLLRATDLAGAKRIHDSEAFGPVATVMAYDNLDQAIELVRRGEGSLVASLFTHDPAVAEAVIVGIAPYHGRILIVDRDCARESNGHGSPLPGLGHGSPGPADRGGEPGSLRA